MLSKTILIVDDNKSVITSLELLFENIFEKVLSTCNPERILSILELSQIDIVILDMNFSAGVNNGNEGLYWLNRIHEIDPELPIIMLTAYGDIELAVKALKKGASDFVLKPWDNSVLIDKVKSAIPNQKDSKPIKKPGSTINCTPNKPVMVIGQSFQMKKVLRIVEKVAKTNANILITGENGTGKEMLAKEIHRLSLRNNKEMITIDMGAVSESLFESELFGHEKGAFTDAKDSRIGKFEAANGSTIFLDEIGNLPINLQAKLLAALQSREIYKLGSNRKIPIDIRLITATNRNLIEMVNKSLFREDLFYRINTIHIEIPPLRNREEDINLFIDFFLKKYSSLYKRNGLSFHPQALAKLLSHDWPGNIRELQHTIEKAVILAEKDKISTSDIIFSNEKEKTYTKITSSLCEIEKEIIESSISQNKGNIKAAAEQLGISRQTLYNKLKKIK